VDVLMGQQLSARGSATPPPPTAASAEIAAAARTRAFTGWAHRWMELRRHD